MSKKISASKEKKPKPKRRHCYTTLVPIPTLQRLIGVKEWGNLWKWLKTKWPKTRTVLSSYTTNGILLVANSPTGKQLGLLKDLLVEAKIQSNPEEEIKFTSTTKSVRPKPTVSKSFKPKVTGKTTEQEIQLGGL
jgi:hypothetical protein